MHLQHNPDDVLQLDCPAHAQEGTAQGITGWLNKNDGGEQSTADLRALLPVDSEGYLATPPHTNFEPDQELLEDITLDDLSSESDEIVVLLFHVLILH